MESMPSVSIAACQQSWDSATIPEPLTPEKVRRWADYARVFYHPKSLVQINEYEGTGGSFDQWSFGEELFHSLGRGEDLIDRDLRPFVEEADQMQGFQIFASVHDAWSAFTSCHIEALRDNYAKAPIWLWGTQGELFNASRRKRLSIHKNTALFIVATAQKVSLLLPMSSGSAVSVSGFDLSSPWYSAGLLAAAVETVTLPSRLLSGNGDCDDLGQMAETLAADSRKTLANVMIRVGENQRLTSTGYQQSPHALKLDLSFRVEPSRRAVSPSQTHVFSQLSAFRGFPPGEQFQSAFAWPCADDLILSR